MHDRHDAITLDIAFIVKYFKNLCGLSISLKASPRRKYLPLTL